jgi:hypothetical protein
VRAALKSIAPFVCEPKLGSPTKAATIVLNERAHGPALYP